MTSEATGGTQAASLVPPQLPPFLANVFNLRPIVGNPSREEVKLVHEAVRALNSFMHTPELRDTDLSTELSQHLFDVQMARHQQKYPVNVLPNDVVYDPPGLPGYIPVQLGPITGPPSNDEIASVHTALRISESFANVPAIFDSDAHAQLSQHLFDIQFARHVQRSIVKRSASANLVSQNQPIDRRGPSNADVTNNSEGGVSEGAPHQEIVGSIETSHATVGQMSHPNEIDNHQNLDERSEFCNVRELIVEMKDALKNMNRVMVGTQNSLARGFNSSSAHFGRYGKAYDLGAHSLINDRGEVPEAYNLPTFKLSADSNNVSFSIYDLTENVLARYLRFYNIGEDLIEEEEELKLKSGMIDSAKQLLSGRLFLNR